MSEKAGAAEARRINCARIPDFVGKTVRFVGKVESVDDSQLTLTSPDGGEIKCVLRGNRGAPRSKYIEVIAEVQEDRTLEQQGHLFELGDELDLDSVNSVINLTFHPGFESLFGMSHAN